jgi:hypothetical protein
MMLNTYNVLISQGFVITGQMIEHLLFETL